MSYFSVEDEYPAVVIDNGSSTCRAGFAGDDAPLSVFPSMVGRRKQQLGAACEKTYIGDEAQAKRELLNLTYPIEHGIVTNWDDMEKIWNHAFFNELKISPKQHPILISEPPLNPKGNREKMAQIMFETYGTPGFFIGYQPLLSCHAMITSHGVLVSIGDGVTYVAPVYDQQLQFNALRRFDFGGRELTRHLQQLLYQQGYSFTTSAELEELREIKENFCFLSQGCEKTSCSPAKSSSRKTYRFQDGSVINLNHELYQCPELLFKPDGIIHSGKSVAETVFDVVSECEFDTRKSLYNYVYLSGGTTFCPGFVERLTTEIEQLVAPTINKVRVVANPDRLFNDWIGGSIYAFYLSTNTWWISSEEYTEYGPDIVNRKYL